MIRRIEQHLPPMQTLAGALTAFLPFALVLGRAVADIDVSTVAILFFANCLLKRDWTWARQPWVAALLALWAYTLVRASFTQDTDSIFAAFGWVRYIVFAAGVAHWILAEGPWGLWLLRATIGAVSFLAIDTVIQYIFGADILGHAPLAYARRLTATYNHPIVGMTMASLFAPALYWLIGYNAILAALFGGLTFIAVLHSGERMALLFAAGILVPWLILFLRSYKKIWLPTLAGFAMLMVFLAASPDLLQRQISSTIIAGQNASSSAYGLAWNSGLQVGKAYPFFGVGMKKFRDACLEERFGPLYDPATGYPRCYVHPHNTYLEWFSEGGYVGLGGFIFCVGILCLTMFRRAAKQPKNFILWGAAATLVIRLMPFFITTSFFNNWEAIPFWLCVGWAMRGGKTVVCEPVTFGLGLKRLIDATVAALALLILSPFMLATALAVRIKLGSPVLFSQDRPGKQERIFRLYKFRSMLPLKRGQQPASDEDARLTKFGAALRATSLDELPELWNVVKGDISLVGPRPLLPEYLPYYSDAERLRHNMSPGLTGLAQVKGRNLLSWDDRFALDIWYVEHWSLWLDLKILLSTVGVVLSRQGISAPGKATMPRFDDFARARRQSGGQ